MTEYLHRIFDNIISCWNTAKIQPSHIWCYIVHSYLHGYMRVKARISASTLSLTTCSSLFEYNNIVIFYVTRRILRTWWLVSRSSCAWVYYYILLVHWTLYQTVHYIQNHNNSITSKTILLYIIYIIVMCYIAWTCEGVQKSVEIRITGLWNNRSQISAFP